jgi:hypothetical protein
MEAKSEEGRPAWARATMSGIRWVLCVLAVVVSSLLGGCNAGPRLHRFAQQLPEEVSQTVGRWASWVQRLSYESTQYVQRVPTWLGPVESGADWNALPPQYGPSSDQVDPF